MVAELNRISAALEGESILDRKGEFRNVLLALDSGREMQDLLQEVRQESRRRLELEELRRDS